MADAISTDTEVNPRDLVFGERAAVVWGFLWRGVVFTLVASLCSGLVGGVIGLVVDLATFGISPDPRLDATLDTVVVVLSLTAGLGITAVGYWYYIRWLLGARFGSMRLKLVRASAVDG